MFGLFRSKQEKSAQHKADGDALLDHGAWAEAAACYRQAVAADPSNAGALNNLALALIRMGKLEEARTCLQQVLQLEPNSINARYQLASMAYDGGQLDEAVDHMRHAVEAAPDFAAGWSFLANALRDQGDAQASVAAWRKALAIEPGNAVIYSSLLMALQAEGALDQAAMHEAHLAYARLAGEVPARPAPGPNQARLKIGYVSADFCRHSVAHFMLPVIEHHDRQRFEIHCYYNVERSDETTQRFAELAEHFIPCAAWTDDELEARIRADGIDVLVDLSGHTAGNRLPVFARKPAPVQVTWLGYIDTTGLTAIDYRFTNADADPPQNDAYCSERLYRLPRLWWAFRPVPGLPELVPLPMRNKGHVTFCSTNQIAKISPAMVETWSRILQAVPYSRLVLMGTPEGHARARLASLFAEHGIDAARLEFHRFTTLDGYRAVLAQADIALDTFPYNGGTTSCETLWLGVPLVTLAGQSFVSRMGYALLRHIGLEALTAKDVDGYVRIATELAGDSEALEALRTGMRERLRNSALADEAGFTRELEAAYLEMQMAAE